MACWYAAKPTHLIDPLNELPADALQVAPQLGLQQAEHLFGCSMEGRRDGRSSSKTAGSSSGMPGEALLVLH